MALRAFVLTIASACAVLPATVHPELPEVRTVYLLTMSNGLDQFMANRLTQTGRFEVVTDPAKADAVFTDRLGAAFEEKWKELYPPPPKVEEAKPTDSKADDGKPTVDGKSVEAKSVEAEPVEVKATEKEKKTPDLIDAVGSQPFTRPSSFSRSRGNIFLVSRKTGAVIWSRFSLPKDSRPKSLDENAERIVDRLQDDLKPKKQ